MPRRKLRLIPGRENRDVNCFAFFRTKSGRPCCNALTDVYCLKEYTPCAFFATPLDAKRAAAKAKSPNGKH